MEHPHNLRGTLKVFHLSSPSIKISGRLGLPSLRVWHPGAVVNSRSTMWGKLSWNTGKQHENIEIATGSVLTVKRAPFAIRGEDESERFVAQGSVWACTESPKNWHGVQITQSNPSFRSSHQHIELHVDCCDEYFSSWKSRWFEKKQHLSTSSNLKHVVKAKVFPCNSAWWKHVWHCMTPMTFQWSPSHSLLQGVFASKSPSFS